MRRRSASSLASASFIFDNFSDVLTSSAISFSASSSSPELPAFSEAMSSAVADMFAIRAFSYRKRSGNQIPRAFAFSSRAYPAGLGTKETTSAIEERALFSSAPYISTMKAGMNFASSTISYTFVGSLINWPIVARFLSMIVDINCRLSMVCVLLSITTSGRRVPRANSRYFRMISICSGDHPPRGASRIAVKERLKDSHLAASSLSAAPAMASREVCMWIKRFSRSAAEIWGIESVEKIRLYRYSEDTIEVWASSSAVTANSTRGHFRCGHASPQPQVPTLLAVVVASAVAGGTLARWRSEMSCTDGCACSRCTRRWCALPSPGALAPRSAALHRPRAS